MHIPCISTLYISLCIIIILDLRVWHTLAQGEDEEYAYSYEWVDVDDAGNPILSEEQEAVFEDPTPMASKLVNEQLLQQEIEKKKETRRAENLLMQQKLKEESLRLEEKKAKAKRDAEQKQKDLQEKENFAKSEQKGYKSNPGKSNRRVMVPYFNDKLLKVMQENYYCVPKKDWGNNAVRTKDSDVKKDMNEDPLLKDSMNRIEQQEDGSTTPEAMSTSSSTTTTTIKKKPKKPSFRELQEKKMQERKEREAKKLAENQSYLPGASCEALSCAACGVLVEHFSKRVQIGIDKQQFVYIDDLIPGFCEDRHLQLSYFSLVTEMCTSLLVTDKSGGYKEALVTPFEEESNWLTATSATALRSKSKQICVSLGACTADYYDVVLKPARKEQEHWDERCFVCQAFANSLEEHLHLAKGLTEGSAVKVVEETCNRLELNDSTRDICSGLVTGSTLHDIGWVAFMHAETIPKQRRTTRLFADKLCEEQKYCEKYRPPEELEAAEVAKIEPVFF